jgi:ABC-type transport system involved in multi-copper enzyme maturation permease subunit
MTRLFGLQVQRAQKREIVRFATCAVLGSVVVACLIAGVRSTRPTREEWRSATALRDDARKTCLANLNPAESPSGCNQGPLASFLPAEVRVFDRASIPAAIVWATVPLGLLSWLIGAGLVGGEWTSGSIATIATWEPRRERILLPAILAGGIVCSIVALVAVASLSVGLLAVASMRGIATETLSVSEVLDGPLRVAVLCFVAGVLGGAVAFVFRSASASLGGLIAYFVVVEIPVNLRLETVAKWLIARNAFGWVGGWRLTDTAAHMFDLGALAVLISWALLSVLIAMVMFARRDVEP